MKKKIIIPLIAILLVGVVVAGIGIANLDRDVELSRQAKNNVDASGLEPFQRDWDINGTDYSCLVADVGGQEMSLFCIESNETEFDRRYELWALNDINLAEPVADNVTGEGVLTRKEKRVGQL